MTLIQTFDPSGVGARDLAECLAIQLRERDRFDPAMKALVANLPCSRNAISPHCGKFAMSTRRIFADMLAEIRQLDPKPGRAFGGGSIQPSGAGCHRPRRRRRILACRAQYGSASRILVNHSYVARVGKQGASDADKTFMSACRQSANWLTKSLEQRARTILKVSSEIVRQQDAFFAARRRIFAATESKDNRGGDWHARDDRFAASLPTNIWRRRAVCSS